LQSAPQQPKRRFHSQLPIWDEEEEISFYEGLHLVLQWSLLVLIGKRNADLRLQGEMAVSKRRGGNVTWDPSRSS